MLFPDFIPARQQRREGVDEIGRLAAEAGNGRPPAAGQNHVPLLPGVDLRATALRHVMGVEGRYTLAPHLRKLENDFRPAMRTRHEPFALIARREGPVDARRPLVGRRRDDKFLLRTGTGKADLARVQQLHRIALPVDIGGPAVDLVGESEADRLGRKIGCRIRTGEHQASAGELLLQRLRAFVRPRSLRPYPVGYRLGRLDRRAKALGIEILGGGQRRLDDHHVIRRRRYKTEQPDESESGKTRLPGLLYRDLRPLRIDPQHVKRLDHVRRQRQIKQHALLRSNRHDEVVTPPLCR